jgi:3-methyladenine DNA glycosylase/8-oxoguanine DNA glycosylase
MGERLADQAPRAPLARLARTFGRPVTTSIPGLTHVFPRPQDLAGADLGAAQIRGAAASRIRALALAVSQRDLTFEASMNLHHAIARVRVVHGIGEEMAGYIAMRAFGEPDAFPIAAAKIPRTAECWRPWRAYAAMYLYLRYQLRV